jgi:DNA helicase II / ATP-dependent DNA helicase PcrA
MTPTTYKPSEFQRPILGWLRRWTGVMNVNAVPADLKRHLRVHGVAGCGKTSTILMCADLLPYRDPSIFLAFNKDIARKLRTKLPKHVPAKTTHSLGYRVCLGSEMKQAGEPTKLKTSLLLRGGDHNGRRFEGMQCDFTQRQVFPQVRKLVAAAKAVGLAPKGVAGAVGLVKDEDNAWLGFSERYNLEFVDREQEDMAIDLARTVLRLSIQRAHELMDFDDMLYMPIVMQMRFPKFKWIFVDEAQDINNVQREIVKRILRPDGHIIAVGDPHQAIYGFRGADSESMENIKRAFNADTLPLSVCYRCSKAVVREAQKLVPEIMYTENAPEGSVTYGLPKGTKLSEFFTPEVSVLSPFNAPLVKLAFRLIREKVAVRVLGKDIGKSVVKMLTNLNAENVRGAIDALTAHVEEQREKIHPDDEDKLQALQDRFETLMVFLDEAPANETIDSVVARINTLFEIRGDDDDYEDDDDLENANILTLSTIHKAKGLEWKRVVLLDTDRLHGTTRGNKPIPEWEIEQRMNLLYVGQTRAQVDLVYLSSEQLEKL